MNSFSSHFSLSPSQKEAVSHFRGPCEVIAGPGSGKTAVLTQRILYLIRERHVDPFTILVLTFSKAAALEMQARFLKSCDGAPGDVTFGTFHSVFYHILQQSSPRPIRVLDGATKRRFLETILISAFPDPSDRPQASELEAELSRYENSGGTLKTYCPSGVFPHPDIFPALAGRYQAFLSENGYLDFDSMLTRCLSLFKSRPDVLAMWQRRFHFLLVDEFQDINPVQYETVRLLSGPRRNLFVVSDDDQSIYRFRGADPSVMQQFTRDFTGARQIFLSENYRCSGAITECARRVISENRIRIPKNIKAVSKAGSPVGIRSFSSVRAENLALCRLFEKMSPGQRSECAVIYRTNLQSLDLCRRLDASGILHTASVCSSAGTVEQEVLEDVSAYFRAAYDFPDRGAARRDLYRIMNRPQRLFPRDICRKERVRPQDLLEAAAEHGGIRDSLITFVRDMRFLSSVLPGYAMRYLMFAMGYARGAVAGREREEAEIRAFTERLLRESAKTKDKRQLFEMLERERSCIQSRAGCAESSKSEGALHILTMHACKGLEFQKVFLPDLNEGVIPSRRADTQQALEEERRLLYVAMTRAKKELTLMYVGGTAENPRRPSRFLQVLGIRAYT